MLAYIQTPRLFHSPRQFPFTKACVPPRRDMFTPTFIFVVSCMFLGLEVPLALEELRLQGSSPHCIYIAFFVRQARHRFHAFVFEYCSNKSSIRSYNLLCSTLLRSVQGMVQGNPGR